MGDDDKVRKNHRDIIRRIRWQIIYNRRVHFCRKVTPRIQVHDGRYGWSDLTITFGPSISPMRVENVLYFFIKWEMTSKKYLKRSQTQGETVIMPLPWMHLQSILSLRIIHCIKPIYLDKPHNGRTKPLMNSIHDCDNWQNTVIFMMKILK